MNVRPESKFVAFKDYASKMVQPKPTRAQARAKPPPTWLTELEGTTMHVFIATRDIKAGEELLMDYGVDYWSHRPHEIPIPCKEHQEKNPKKHFSQDTEEEDD